MTKASHLKLLSVRGRTARAENGAVDVMAGYDLNERAVLIRTVDGATTAEILRSNSLAEGTLRKMLILAVSDSPENRRRYSITIKDRALLLRSDEITALASAHGIVPVT